MKTISEVAAYTEKQLDAHLMVTDPDSYIDELINAGVKKNSISYRSREVSGSCTSTYKKKGWLRGTGI